MGGLRFHSAILGFTMEKALPFASVDKVELQAATALGGQALVVREEGGASHSFVVATLSPPDFPERVLEVIEQLLEVWRRRAGAGEEELGSGPPMGHLRDEGVGVEEGPDGKGGSATASQGAAGGTVEGPLQQKASQAPLPLPSPVPPQPPLQGQEAGTPTSRGPRSLRHGIQAFLEESQIKKTGGQPAPLLDLS
jgi:hypothetical protein